MIMAESLPRVSVCVPCLNTARYLEQRLDTILAQTFGSFEVVIGDSYSDDGSWEIIERYAARDPRVRAMRIPREGVYPGINRCIEAARGEMIYLAMSDDTMEPRCLERMVDALDRHPGCGMAHCCLTVIGPDGEPEPEGDRWEHRVSVRYFGPLIGQEHVRRAPHDGLLAMGLNTVYTSLTQLLVRREVYGRTGLFRDDWGSFGDLEWQMRAALLFDTVHVPEPLATWRKHAAQASDRARHREARRQGEMSQMVDAALSWYETIDRPAARRIRRSLFRQLYELDRFWLHLAEAGGRRRRAAVAAAWLGRRPSVCLAALRIGEPVQIGADVLIDLARREMTRMAVAPPEVETA